MRYLGESLAILKAIDSPMLTLMSVANPWMRGSPDPLMSHSVDGFPGLQFSATTLLAGFAHAAAPCGARCAVPGVDGERHDHPRACRSARGGHAPTPVFSHGPES
jgi:hypothetical protein